MSIRSGSRSVMSFLDHVSMLLVRIVCRQKKGKSFEFQSCLALHNILNVLSLVNMDKAFVCVTKMISNVAKNKRANNIMIIIIVSAFRLFLFLLFSALRISSPLSCSLIFSCWIRKCRKYTIKKNANILANGSRITRIKQCRSARTLYFTVNWLHIKILQFFVSGKTKLVLHVISKQWKPEN